MQKQASSVGRIGRLRSTLPGGLFQEQDKHGWRREWDYLQKFTEGSRTVQRRAVREVSTGLCSHYFQGAEKQPNKATVLPAGERFHHGGLKERGNSFRTEGEAYGILPASHGMRGQREWVDMVHPTANTSAQPWYLQQKNRNLYDQTQVYPREVVFPKTAVYTDGEAGRIRRITVLPEGAFAGRISPAAQPVGLSAGLGSSGGIRENTMQGSSLISAGSWSYEEHGGHSAFSSGLNGRGKQPVFCIEPASQLTSANESDTPRAFSTEEWAGLLATLRKTMAESLTELLQNMIPETEDR